jgi:signal transduction histidine kinase
LHYDENALFLTIKDNGIGFDVKEILQGSYFFSSGLKNIIKRSSLINAQYEILSTPENGTTITIITPFLNEVCQPDVAK